MNSKVLFSSASVHWSTPKAVYDELDAEFHFNDDPCPLGDNIDGLMRAWGSTTFVNPPYGNQINNWCRKAYEESLQGKTIVMLLPSRTDVRWWHEYVMKATEIRFIRGRLKFGSAKYNAPFPSAIVIFSEKITNAQVKK